MVNKESQIHGRMGKVETARPNSASPSLSGSCTHLLVATASPDFRTLTKAWTQELHPLSAVISAVSLGFARIPWPMFAFANSLAQNIEAFFKIRQHTHEQLVFLL